MTSEHIFFIPAVLLVGAGIGYSLGRKWLLAELQEQQRAMARKAARQQAKVSQETASTDPPA